VQVDAMIRAVTRTRTMAKWAEALTHAAPNHLHLQARKMMVTAVHPQVGPIKFPGQALALLKRLTHDGVIDPIDGGAGRG
jgi:hypothetical protein